MDRLNAARAAFDAGKFAEAAAGFAGVEQDFGQNPQATKAIAAHRALHAMALARAGDAAAALPAIDAAMVLVETTPVAREGLAYLKGLMLFQLQRWGDARADLLAYFDKPVHPRQRRLEALLLAGTCYQKDGDLAGAAKFFKDAAGKIRKAEPVAAARADLVSLQCLVQAGDIDGALAAVRDGYLVMAGQPQVITFQMLTLELGNQCLTRKRWLDAIVCFQRVWARERLLRHQRDRLDAWQRERAVASRQPAVIDTLTRLDGMIAAATTEVTMLEANPGFDAATRYRLASAFLQLGRHAEAATILEAMLRQLPPDAVVEQSAVPLVQCWIQAKRWEKAVEAADIYEQRFGSTTLNANHPTVLLLKASALESDARHADAAGVCGVLVARFPKAKVADVAGFKQGWLLLMADRHEDGLRVLRAFPQKFPSSSLREDAAYWEGEALAMLGKHEQAREVLGSYLAGVKKKSWRGDYSDGAQFRRAFCRFALAKYDDAITELRAFRRAYPESPYADEAALLLGDALCGVGRIDDGLAEYRKIKPAAGRFHEEAVFKMGKAMRLTGDLSGMRTHFAAFLKASPGSSRVAEAVHWMCWSWQQSGEESKAREAAWQAVSDLGNDPEQAGVEDILVALAKMHRRDEESGRVFMLRLHQLAESAKAADGGKSLLTCRARWARAEFVRRVEPVLFRTEMLAAAEDLDARKYPPRLSVDIAEAVEDLGLSERAEEILIDTRKWHPRTLEKARIYAGLAKIADKRGDSKAALAAYARIDQENLIVPASLRAAMEMDRARLEAAAGNLDRAQEIWKQIQGDRALPARTRAEAYLLAGRAVAEKDPAQAAPYFERVYVAYGAFPEFAADAYLARARCLERLGHHEKAREVYRELTQREDMAGLSAAVEEAKRKLEAIP